jgi:hypothetical protein
LEGISTVFFKGDIYKGFSSIKEVYFGDFFSSLYSIKEFLGSISLETSSFFSEIVNKAL